jgi:hypothetical protein
VNTIRADVSVVKASVAGEVVLGRKEARNNNFAPQ